MKAYNYLAAIVPVLFLAGSCHRPATGDDVALQVLIISRL